MLILKLCRLYNVFSSGATHGIYAQFMAQSANANNGRKIGMLRGSGTRMALWFYAGIRMLRLREPLLATVHQQKFRDLKLNDTARRAVLDIKDQVFWKTLYALLRAVFPALRALRYCDSNIPAMDKIAMLTHRTTVAIGKSKSSFNDENLFGSKASFTLQAEEAEVFGEVEGDEDDMYDDDE